MLVGPIGRAGLGCCFDGGGSKRDRSLFCPQEYICYGWLRRKISIDSPYLGLYSSESARHFTTSRMSSSIPGRRELPASQYDLSTYWGRVRHSANISDPRTLVVNSAGLEHAKALIARYKQGTIAEMNPELWNAKKIADSTLHPDTGEPVLLPFRMSCFVLSNLVVTAGMLTPGLGTTGTLLWQITNQSLNVAINNANANKSTPLSTSKIAQSYFLAVGASCSVALGLNALVPRLKRVSPATKIILTRLVPFAAVASAGALNVFLMRGEEIRKGIDVYPVLSEADKANLAKVGKSESAIESLGKSKKAATLAVSETAVSRVLNSSPIMVIPPMILVRLQKQEWLKKSPRLTLPVNLGLILGTSLFALPLALAAFPQRQAVDASSLEEEFWGKGGENGKVVFNRGI
ncbi:sideroflexin-5 [Amylocarpus encephaloides]|uniref:Sideroflexin-5 n=1 Tax=Amylocarpus encephaloides TaxID=45428 RepID=A0A9P8C3N5_9HELO|nr:sideroflexin-5 [Amylocarpus encephaloides]